MKAPKRELFVAVVLGFLMLLAFSIRLDNFRKSEWQTIDEIVYYRLGSQITRNLADYHTIPYARELMARGRDLPEYFTRPLFKHPPLFSFLISLSIRFFGDNLESALYPSLFLGVLMIPLIYLLGLSIYDHRVGLLGALFVSLDPVSIICSQKVWMDTTVSFFMVLAVFLFIRGLKSGRDGFFVLSGLASGLAAATKYPGILATLCVVAYALIYRRDLFRNKGFFLGLGMPVVVLLPWFFWNYQIYGKDFLKMQGVLHSEFSRFLNFSIGLLFLGVLIVLGVGAFFLLRRLKASGPLPSFKLLARFEPEKFRNLFLVSLAVLFVFGLQRQLLHSLQIFFLPKTTWYGGAFSNEPSTFYIGRLMEFSLVYVFAFASFFIPRGQREDSGAILRISTIVILLFFVLMRNFQSRYILPCIPLLLLLGAKLISRFMDKVKQQKSFSLRLAGNILLAAVLFLIFAKLFFINMMLSYPNDLCYF